MQRSKFLWFSWEEEKRKQNRHVGQTFPVFPGQRKHEDYYIPEEQMLGNLD
ncbi:hypothetical protein LEMLEM_LOCUS13609 [Lemmus lemmus]